MCLIDPPGSIKKKEKERRERRRKKEQERERTTSLIASLGTRRIHGVARLSLVSSVASKGPQSSLPLKKANRGRRTLHLVPVLFALPLLRRKPEERENETTKKEGLHTAVEVLALQFVG